MPVYTAFSTESAELTTAIGAYCEALGNEGEAEARQAARAAWNEAMAQWQLAEAMLLGPAAMDSATLRDRIYSWPITSTCSVDRNVVDWLAAPAAYDIRLELVVTRGLDAIEYLLFSESLATTCPPQSAPAGWQALTTSEQLAARCGFAEVAAVDVSAQAQVIVDAWLGDDGFLADLRAAGTDDSSFDSVQKAVNVVSHALFYLDGDVKDMKLAQPAGIADNVCNAVEEPCPEELELRLSGYSKEAVIANLTGFAMLFRGQTPAGDDGLGFDDYLRAVGAGEVADTMLSDVAAAIAAAETVPGDLETALASDYAAVVAAHAATRRVTDTLKSQFLTVLGLDIPDAAAGDND